MKQEKIFHEHHMHSHYSIGDCVNKIPDIVKRSKLFGRKSVTLTDHGTLGGIYELNKECKVNGLKPIFGIEAYFVDDYNLEESNVDWNYAHIILLAATQIGWNNLKILQRKAWIEGYRKKPRITLKDLEEHGSGLICTTACMKGIIGWNYISGNDKYFSDESLEKRMSIVRKRLNRLRDCFCVNDLYFEIQYNELNEQKTLNEEVIRLAREYQVHVIAGGDCHYIKPSDYKIHDILICYHRKKLLTDVDNGTYSTHELYMKDTDLMYESWKKYHSKYCSEETFWESIDSTIAISEKVGEIEIKPKSICLPEWKESGAAMQAWTLEGWEKYLTKEQQENKVYKDRLQYEFEVFDQLKMESYMLVCADLIRRARNAGISVGPGRGSVCGSLVAYLMGITQIDPIRFDTSFDRFLIKTRLSLPDIDMDFGITGREKVKTIVRELYGDDTFAAIVTFGDWKPRGVMKDVGKVLGRTFTEMNEITKKISDKTKSFEDEEEPINPEVLDWLNENKDIYNPSRKLQGVYRQKGVHASGMILTPSRLEDWVPIAYITDRDSEDKKPLKISEWDMYALEDLEILKIDFLGLQTLDVIADTVKLINKNGKILENIWDTCLKDLENKKVYDEIQIGNVLGMFQLETSEGMLKLIKEMMPRSFEDIVLLISLYRSAVLETGMVDEYIKRRNGAEFKYIHKITKPVLKNTYGTMIFQEQCMGIAVVAAGFTGEESDNFRKGTKLKDPEKFKPWQEKFVNGCLKNGLTKREANKLWDWCRAFASYGFNRSHACGYALITYVTAWLKTYYPLEFMTSLMSYNAGDEKMMPKYMTDCKRLGLKVLNPNINVSTNEFIAKEVKKEKIIVSPFSAIKGIGDKAIAAILEERKSGGKFEDFEEFNNRVNKRVINVKIMSNLILAGCFADEGTIEEIFDKFIELRKGEKTYRQLYCSTCKKRYLCSVEEKKTEGYCCPFCDSTQIFFADGKCKGKPFDKDYVHNLLYGFVSGEDKIKKYIDKVAKHKAEAISEIENYEDGDNITVCAFIKKVKKHIDKNNNTMAFLDISDGVTDCTLTIFASDYLDLKDKIKEGYVYIITAYKNRGNNLLYQNRYGKVSKLISLGV